MTTKIIIDGSNLLHRSHWVAKTRKLSPVYLFLASVKKYANQYNCNAIYTAWDGRHDRYTVNFRRELLGTQYKGTRDKEKNTEVFKNVEMSANLCEYLGVINLRPNILEADDIIAWLCREKYVDDSITVITTDQDMLQLVSNNVTVYNPIKDIEYTPDNFEELIGVPLEFFVQYKAVIGDKSDNIDGVPGAGPKRAQKIVVEQGVSTQTQEHQDIINRNFKLMCLNYSLEHNRDECEFLEKQITDKLAKKKVEMNRFFAAVTKLNMNTIIKNKTEWSELFSKQNVISKLNDMIGSMDISSGFDK